MKNKLWILTYAVNDYNQHGEYFLAAWPYKPTKEELAKAIGLLNSYRHEDMMSHEYAVKTVDKLWGEGGGRQDIEQEWYFLREYEEGETSNFHEVYF